MKSLLGTSFSSAAVIFRQVYLCHNAYAGAMLIHLWLVLLLGVPCDAHNENIMRSMPPYKFGSSVTLVKACCMPLSFRINCSSEADEFCLRLTCVAILCRGSLAHIRPSGAPNRAKIAMQHHEVSLVRSLHHKAKNVCPFDKLAQSANSPLSSLIPLGLLS